MIFKRKLYEEFLARKARRVIDARTFVAYYEVNGAEREFKMESGKIGVFELLSWLPFQEQDEAYEKPEKVRWMFLGYKDGKKIDDMTYKEFKEEKRRWKDFGDVAPNVRKTQVKQVESVKA